jgi:hypothetical protein
MHAPRTSRRRTRRDEPETMCVLACGVRMRSDQKMFHRPHPVTQGRTHERDGDTSTRADRGRMPDGTDLVWRLTLKEDGQATVCDIQRHPQSPQ